MFLQVLQSGIVPFAVVLLMAGLFNQRWGAALGMALAVISAWLWIKGWLVPWPPRAVDLVVAAALLGSVFLVGGNSAWLSGNRGVMASAAVLAGLLLWACRILLPEWGSADWMLGLVAPVLIITFALFVADRAEISQRDAANAGLALLAYQPLVLSIGGSLLMGQLAGVLTTGFAALWVLMQVNRIQLPARGVLGLALLPGLMLLVVAWQFAEISPSALSLGLLLPLLYLALLSMQRLPAGWWVRHGLLAVALGIQLGIGLWLVWPEQSLY